MVKGRLTERNESGGITVKDAAAAFEKLAELEDAATQDSLVNAITEIAGFCAVNDCENCPFSANVVGWNAYACMLQSMAPYYWK